MKNIKKFNESMNGSDSLENFANEIGLDSKWLLEYLIDSIRFDLDPEIYDEMNMDQVLAKLENYRK